MLEDVIVKLVIGGMSVRAAAGQNRLPLTDSTVRVAQRSFLTVRCQQL